MTIHIRFFLSASRKIVWRNATENFWVSKTATIEFAIQTGQHGKMISKNVTRVNIYVALLRIYFSWCTYACHHFYSHSVIWTIYSWRFIRFQNDLRLSIRFELIHSRWMCLPPRWDHKYMICLMARSTRLISRRLANHLIHYCMWYEWKWLRRTGKLLQLNEIYVWMSRDSMCW